MDNDRSSTLDRTGLPTSLSHAAPVSHPPAYCVRRRLGSRLGSRHP